MRKIHSTWAYGGLLLFSLAILALYILGAARYLTDHDENACDMTYMFEYPQYIRVSLKEELEDRFPRFGLYVYGEGFATEKYRRMRFTGIPIIFVPGNAGSHKQVRSLASVSLRKSLNDRTPFHFDFFTISFSESYSALYGGVLMEQTEYLSHCIQKILQLYDGKHQSIVIIGHSMGGIVAKGALLLMPETTADVASIIITMATPHVPSFVLDSTIANYYNNLHELEGRFREAKTNIISIGGGPRDIMVTAARTVDSIANLNVLTTNIPYVWRSTDHLSILWCKQLMLVMVRALFDCVDTTDRPARISSNSEHRLQALSYHLLHRSAGKRLYSYQKKVQFERGGEWIENIRRQYVWNSRTNIINKTTTAVYLMIRLIGSSDRLTIETIHLEARDWLFICSASKIQDQSRVCEWGWNLTNCTRSLSDIMHRNRKTVDLNLNEIKEIFKNMTHVIVRILPTDLRRDVTVHVDLHSKSTRTLHLGNEISFLEKFLGLGKFGLIEYNRGNVRYHVMLVGTVNAIAVELKNIKCNNASNPHHGIVELLESSNPGAGQVRLFTKQDKGPKIMRMQTIYGQRDVIPILRMTLNPTCSYIFNIQQAGIVEKIAHIVRDHWPIVYTASISWLILAIAIRVDHGQGAVVTIAVTSILSLSLGLGLESCVALAILHILAATVCFSIVSFGTVVHNITLRFLARAVAFSTTWSDWLLGGLNQLPFVTTLLVLSLIPATCGALAMLLSTFLYFLKLTRMYEDYLEELLIASLQHFQFFGNQSQSHDSEKHETTKEKILNHLILFLTWCYAALPAIPSALVWAKHFSYNTRLTTEDPILLGSWIVLAGCGTLGIVRIPSSHRGYRSRALAIILRCMGWLILFAAGTGNPSYHHRWIPPLIATVIGLITIDSIVPNAHVR